MFNWLRNWLAVTPAPIHMDISAEAVAVARPGDLVIVSTSQHLSDAARERVVEVFRDLQEESPGIKFFVLGYPLGGSVKREAE